MIQHGSPGGTVNLSAPKENFMKEALACFLCLNTLHNLFGREFLHFLTKKGGSFLRATQFLASVLCSGQFFFFHFYSLIVGRPAR